MNVDNLVQARIEPVRAYQIVEVMTMAQIGTLDRIVDDATRRCSGEPDSMQDYLAALLEQQPESTRKPSLWRDEMGRRRRAVRGRWE